MQTRILFSVSQDSRVSTLTIESNLPITMPEFIEHFERWLADTKQVYAKEIEVRKLAFQSGKVVPFNKER